MIPFLIMRIYRCLPFLFLFVLQLSFAAENSIWFLESKKHITSSWVDPLIQQRGSATTGTTNNTSLSIAKPTGIVAGDVMIANISLGRKNSASTANPSLTGWTLISGAQFDNSKNYRGAVLYRVATADDASLSNYTFSLGTGTSGGAGTIVAFANVDVSGATPFDVTPGNLHVSPTVQTNSVVANSITTSKANAGIVMLTQSNDNVNWDNTLNGSTAWRATSPSILTEISDHAFIGADDRLSVGIAWSVKPTAGQTGDGLVNQSTLRNFGAILIALKPISTVTPTPAITSTLTGSSVYGTSSSYQITASYDPTSFSAVSLPLGMSLDGATGVLTIGSNTAAGVYAISLSATNTTGTGETATLNYTVHKKSLTVTANNILKCYGANHTFNTSLFSSSGLVLGEVITAVDFTSAGEASSAAVGTYLIVPSNATGTNGFHASNYEITYESTGTLVVRPLNSWHGSSNTAWTNTANWCLAGTLVPGATDTAIIYPSNNSPELGDSYTLMDLIINSGASILLKTANTLTLLGSFTNDGSLNMEGTSRVIFGAGAHTIAGSTITTFNNLTINSGRDIAVNQTIGIANQLTLSNGYLVPIDGKLITLSNGSSVTGVSNNSYVRGAVKKVGTNGGSNYAFDFPIGKSGTAFYYPVRIVFPNATTTEEVTVSYHGSAYNTNLKNTNVKEVANEYWMITPSTLVANASGLQVKIQYKSPTSGNYLSNATSVNYYKVGHFSTATNTWEVAVGLDAAQNSVDAGSTLSEGYTIANGVTEFSRFTTIEIISSVLPIHLKYFIAKVVPQNKVVLYWSTDQEMQNKGFVIERATSSSQGKFQRIGYIYSKAVKGNSALALQYQFTDGVHLEDSYAYYRLLQEDIDGRTSPSEIRLVKFNKQTPIHIAVETSNGKVTISRNVDKKRLDYRVVDQIGRVISEGKSIVDQVFTIYIPGNGVFNLHLHLPETGEQLIKRVLVQK